MEEHAVRVEQIRWRRPRDAQRDVGVDQLGHPVFVGQTVRGGQLNTQLALIVRYLTRASLVGCNRHHNGTPSRSATSLLVRRGLRGCGHGAAAPSVQNLNKLFADASYSAAPE